MSTVREQVSAVRSTHRLLSGDVSINDRTIASELKSDAITLIRQYTDKRKLWATDTIFTTIPCLEMIEVPISECCGFVSDIKVGRSKQKLPSISEGQYQYLIQGVYNIELSEEVKYMTVRRYINALKLGLQGNKIYYWIHDGYIFCSSPYVQELKVIAYIEGDLPDEILYRDCSCEGKMKKKDCFNPLDQPFKCPGFLEGPVRQMTSARLLQTYFRIPEDRSSDNKDEQTK